MQKKVFNHQFLFKNFLSLLMQKPKYKPHPVEKGNLKDLAYILGQQLKIMNSGGVGLPDGIPLPVLNMYPKLLNDVYDRDKNAFKYVCEKVIQYNQKKSSVDLSDKLLQSLLRKTLNRLIEEIVEVQIDNEIKILSRKIAVLFEIPFKFVPDLRNFISKYPIRTGKFTYAGNELEVVVDEDDEEKLYLCLKNFLEKKEMMLGKYTNEKLTFGDLKTGDLFIGFPTPGDNSGHSGFLGAYRVFVKINEDKQGNNAERAINTKKVRSHFPKDFLILKVD